MNPEKKRFIHFRNERTAGFLRKNSDKAASDSRDSSRTTLLNLNREKADSNAVLSEEQSNTSCYTLIQKLSSTNKSVIVDTLKTIHVKLNQHLDISVKDLLPFDIISFFCHLLATDDIDILESALLVIFSYSLSSFPYISHRIFLLLVLYSTSETLNPLIYSDIPCLLLKLLQHSSLSIVSMVS